MGPVLDGLNGIFKPIARSKTQASLERGLYLGFILKNEPLTLPSLGLSIAIV